MVPPRLTVDALRIVSCIVVADQTACDVAPYQAGNWARPGPDSKWLMSGSDGCSSTRRGWLPV